MKPRFRLRVRKPQAGSGITFATEVTQYGATFKFTEARQVGQYCNGDWWVVGPVTISQITPDCTTMTGSYVGGTPWTTADGTGNRVVNGAMINPGNHSYAPSGLVINNSIGGANQGFDSLTGAATLMAYGDSVNVDPGKTGQPLTFTAGQEASVCKAIYNPTVATTGRASILDMVILTVVSAAPAADAFRPPMSSSSKTSRWRESQLDYSVFPNLASVTGAISLATAAGYVARPWQVWYTNNTNSRNMSPANSHPEYGQQQASRLQAVGLTLCYSATNADKRSTLIGLTQIGIDTFGRVKDEGGVYEQRGAGSMGHKLPLVTAALALNDAEMKEWCDPTKHSVFAEDRGIWEVGLPDVGRALYVEFGRTRELYTYPMVGMAEWGEQHSYQPNRDASNWSTAFYRLQWVPCMIGHALYYRLLNGGMAVANNATFQAYMDRAWNYQKNAATGAEGSNAISPQVHNSWTAYRNDTGSTPPTFAGATARGDQVWLSYSDYIDTQSVPATTDFTVTEGGVGKTVSAVVNVGKSVVLTLSAAFNNGTSGSIAYTKGANPIQDYRGNDAANVTTTALTNITPTPVPAGAPVNSVLPAITGTPTVGQTLSCSTGTWSNIPLGYTYQWTRDGADIDESISPTRVLTSSDQGAVMACRVTATNAAGSGAPATSAGTSAVAAAPGALPANTIAPVISGSGVYGEVHTVTSNGTWSNSPSSYAYQWRADGVAVSGANSSTWTPPAQYFSSIIDCRVTAQNANGSGVALSNEIGPLTGVDPIQRNTYDVTYYGSSSTAGNHGWTGSMATVLEGLVAGSKAVTNRGAGGATTTGVKTALGTATTAQKAGTNIIQYDTNSWNSGGPGTDWLQFADFVNNALPLLDASAVSGKRVFSWTGTEDGYGAYRNLRNQRFQRLMWAQRPGQHVNMQDYWRFAPVDPSFVSSTSPYIGATDATTQANGQIAVSYQIADRSHPDQEGDTYFVTAWQKDAVQAVEGGVPFFAYYPYYSTAATAQTLGGDVIQLQYVGDLSNTDLAVLALDGTAHPHFGVSSTGMLIRVSGAALKDQFYEFLLSVTKNGTNKRYRQRVAIGALTGVPQRKLVAGHTWASLETNDNQGTLLAPSFPSGSTRLWAGLGAGDFYEQSLVFDFEPTVDGVQMYLMHMGAGIQVQRTAANQIRVSNRDKSAVAHGQITTATGGGVANVANGRFLAFYSIKVDAGAAFQQLILDNGTDTIRHTAPVVSPTGATVNLNPLANGLQFNALVGSTQGGTNGVGLPTLSSNTQGKVGFMWMSDKAIDWSVAANRGLFRNSLTDLIDLTTSSSGKRPGDGRSVIVQAGGLGYNAGATVTPYYYDRGGAADFGRNFGTGGDIETVCRRDPTGASPYQGIALGV